MFLLATLGLALAQDSRTADDYSRLYYGARTGVSIPMGSSGVAMSYGGEVGLERNKGLYGLRIMYYPNPPDFLSYTNVGPAVGPLADLRYNFVTVAQLDMYVIGTAGFLVASSNGENAMLPIIAGGVGARVRMPDDRFAFSFDFGITDFTVPYLALSVNGLSAKFDAAE